VQNLDISLLAPQTKYNPELYLPYLDNKIIYASLRRLTPPPWKYRYVPFYGFAGRYHYVYAAICGLFGIDYTIRTKGFLGMDTPWDGSFEVFKKTNPGGLNYPIDPASAGILRNIVFLARSKGSRVIFVYSPELTENHAYTKNRGEIFSLYREVAADTGVPLWDYSFDKISRNKGYFYNSQHLNRAGAEVFSGELALKIKKLTPTAPRPPKF
jgi:hypothetical protein